MNVSDVQIKKMYDELGLTPEQIAEQMELSLPFIKESLSLYSTRWNNGVSKGTECDISETEFRMIVERHKNIALTTEDQATAERASRFWIQLMERRRERREDAKEKQQTHSAVQAFNALLRAGRGEKIVDV